MKVTIWIDTDGGEHISLPRNWKGMVSPVTAEWALANGWTREERELDDPPPPVVRYSRYKIYLRLRELGLWETFQQALLDMGLVDSWYNITDIASDNPELQAALPRVREAFPSLDVDAELASCVAE